MEHTQEKRIEQIVIEASRISCTVGKKYLLKDVNLNIKRGENWLIHGANGSGKTTLLSLLAGYNQLYAGSLKVLGMSYTEQSVFATRRKIGFVSTSFFDKYYRNESVSDIMFSALSGTLGVRPGITATTIKQAKKELSFFGLADKFQVPYRTLSKGEQQKILLARAFLQNPELLLLDEPASGLDVASEQQMKELVREQTEKADLTLLYVSHHPYEFGDVFDQCLILDKGKVKASGLTKEVLYQARREA